MQLLLIKTKTRVSQVIISTQQLWKTKVWKFKTRANGVELTINRVQITYSTLCLHDRRVTKDSHEKILTGFTMFPTRQNMGENNGGGVNQDWENWPQKKCAIVHECSERGGGPAACLPGVRHCHGFQNGSLAMSVNTFVKENKLHLLGRYFWAP